MQLFKINPLKGLSGITIQEIYITFNAISNRILYWMFYKDDAHT